MFRNYVLSAIRFTKRNSLYAGVNVVGLSISLTFCLMILIYIGGAFGWDKMHPERADTYLISLQKYLVDNPSEELEIFDFKTKEIERYSVVSYVHAQGLVENFPEIEDHTMIFNLSGVRKTNVEVARGKIYEESIVSAEGAFFDIFNFPTIHGNPEQALKTPQTIVLSKSTAEKYFKNSEPIGRSINLIYNEKSTSFVVGAVVEVPEKSSVSFEMLIGFSSDERLEGSDFASQSRAQYTFFTRLTTNINLEVFDDKVNTYFTSTFSDYIDNQRRFSDLAADSKLLELKATNLSAIHLSRIQSWYNKANYQSIILTILFVSVLIIISGINYLLISLAMLSKRTSSVSIRRVVGAKNRSILFQFWLENSVTTIIALLIAICMAQLLLPYAQNILQEEFIWSFGTLFKWAGYLLIILMGISFMVSLYPAKLVTRFKLTDSLKSGSTYKSSTSFMNFLITAQFIICFGFIGSGLIMGTQVKYILNKDLGFDKEETIKINAGNELLTQRLESLASVESVGRGGAWQFGHGQMGFLEKIDGEPYTLVQLDSDKKLLDLLNLNIQWLVEDFGESPAAIINGDLADLLGRDSLTYKVIGFNQRIVGILEDTYLLPLTEQRELYFISPNSESRRLRETYVKFKAGMLDKGLSDVREVWSELYPKSYFKYNFLDDYVAENYKEYESTSSLINTTTILAVVIACLGLFALNGIVVNNRMKEFGIRKVLGASVGNIIRLVNTRILIIYFASLTVALPITYYLMQNWLSKFRFLSNQLEQKFALTALIGLLLIIATVCLHTLRSSRVNPVELLKDE